MNKLPRFRRHSPAAAAGAAATAAAAAAAGRPPAAAAPAAQLTEQSAAALPLPADTPKHILVALLPRGRSMWSVEMLLTCLL